jgi:hypothetical protein
MRVRQGRLLAQVLTVLAAVVPAGCGSGGGGEQSVTAPSIPAPSGCSGNAVKAVEFSFLGPFSPVAFTASLGSGDAMSGEARPGQHVRFNRDLVSCDYEISGQFTGSTFAAEFTVEFGIARTGAALGELSGGVANNSIVIVQGPNAVVRPPVSQGACVVTLSSGGGGGLGPGPHSFRIRFRVQNGNGNACGLPL